MTSMVASKGINNPQARKPAEVAVSCDELGDSVLEAKSGDVRVVNQVACRGCLANGYVEHRKVPVRFGEQNKRRRCQQSSQVF